MGGVDCLPIIQSVHRDPDVKAMPSLSGKSQVSQCCYYCEVKRVNFSDV